MKYFTVFEQEDAFHGFIKPIKDIKAFYLTIYDRTYLLGHMNDDAGRLRPVDTFTEEELLGIAKKVWWTMSDVHLVDSIEQLCAISTDDNFQKAFNAFCEENHSAG